MPSTLLPFPNGGVQAIWERGDDELQVDVGPDGMLGYLSIRRGAGPPTMAEREGVSLVEILDLIDRVGR